MSPLSHDFTSQVHPGADPPLQTVLSQVPGFCSSPDPSELLSPSSLLTHLYLAQNSVHSGLSISLCRRVSWFPSLPHRAPAPPTRMTVRKSSSDWTWYPRPPGSSSCLLPYTPSVPCPFTLTSICRVSSNFRSQRGPLCPPCLE